MCVFPRKLKKLIRYIQSKQGAFQEEERQKKLQRYETDHFLEPFAGLTPEYMEMSERPIKPTVLHMIQFRKQFLLFNVKINCCSPTNILSSISLLSSPLSSHPVRLCDSVRGILPPRSSFCFAKQHHWNTTGCQKVCGRVAPPSGSQSQRHWWVSSVFFKKKNPLKTDKCPLVVQERGNQWLMCWQEYGTTYYEGSQKLLSSLM